MEFDEDEFQKGLVELEGKYNVSMDSVHIAIIDGIYNLKGHEKLPEDVKVALVALHKKCFHRK
jgi:hypothetical protein